VGGREGKDHEARSRSGKTKKKELEEGVAKKCEDGGEKLLVGTGRKERQEFQLKGASRRSFEHRSIHGGEIQSVGLKRRGVKCGEEKRKDVRKRMTQGGERKKMSGLDRLTEAFRFGNYNSVGKGQKV